MDEVEAFHVRQEKILEDEVGRGKRHQLQRGPAVRRLQDHVALGGEGDAHQLAGQRVILDDEDGGGLDHGRRPAGRGGQRMVPRWRGTFVERQLGGARNDVMHPPIS
jgi:hypothetical protein